MNPLEHYRDALVTLMEMSVCPEKVARFQILKSMQLVTPDQIQPWSSGLLEPNYCYNNCGVSAIHNDRFIYCEGFATSASLREFPFEHAWLYDQETNKFTCPTWGEDFVGAFGVGFDSDWILNWASFCKSHGVLINLMHDRKQEVWDSEALIPFSTLLNEVQLVGAK